MGNFTFENQGVNTYLVYTIEDDTPLDTLSLGMLTNNKIEGLVPVVYTQMDTTKFLKYNISSKIALQQYFQGTVTRKQILGVFLSITKAMLLAEEYMIIPSSLILDMDRIYIDVSNCTAELVCLPLMNKNAAIDVGSFFKNIVFTARFAQNENCDYVTSIINYLNSTQSFSLTEFMKLLEDLTDVGNVQTSSAAIQTPPTAESQKEEQKGQNTNTQTSSQGTAYTNLLQNKENAWQVSQPQPSQVHTVPVEPAPHREIVPPVNSPAPAPADVSEDSEVKKGKFGLFRKKDKKNKKEKQNQSHGSLGMQTSAPKGMDIPGMRKRGSLESENNKNIRSMSATPGMPNNIHVPEQQKSIDEIAATSAPMGIPLPAQNVTQPSVNPGKPANFGDTVVLTQPGTVGETSVLSGMEVQRELKPCLIRRKSGEQVWINVPVFTVGREASYVNYCISDNSAISKCHANIITKDKQYYIVDTNSRNHTFLDGDMIPANEEKLLSNGSKIKLANEEFEFRLR